MPAKLDGLLVDHLLVCLGKSLGIIYIPSKGTEYRIDELTPQFSLIIIPEGTPAGMLCNVGSGR
jgi:hypothetical protein